MAAPVASVGEAEPAALLPEAAMGRQTLAAGGLAALPLVPSASAEPEGQYQPDAATASQEGASTVGQARRGRRAATNSRASGGGSDCRAPRIP